MQINYQNKYNIDLEDIKEHLKAIFELILKPSKLNISLVLILVCFGVGFYFLYHTKKGKIFQVNYNNDFTFNSFLCIYTNKNSLIYSLLPNKKSNCKVAL